MICVGEGAGALALAASAFTLSWTHSVERTEWRERWVVERGALRLTDASVMGSGAGIDPPEGAVLRDGAYHWRPTLPPVPQLALAASGATPSGWTLCPSKGACVLLGTTPGEPIAVRACPGAQPMNPAR